MRPPAAMTLALALARALSIKLALVRTRRLTSITITHARPEARPRARPRARPKARDQPVELRQRIGGQYLSNATCLIRPNLFYAFSSCQGSSQFAT